ncbi:MAG TPA: DinB family protein [Gemmatimonadaceae bacterium]|nr:DinB family protein [Gemmatimonadaceae bacterium]
MNQSVRLIAASLVLPLALAAQGSDPITGTWTGHIGPGATPQFAVTMDLKFDGKSVVTGTLTGLPSPGDVKRGTFDLATGALRLEMGESGQAAARLILEGTVVLGSVTGRVTADNQTGTFRIAKGAAAAAEPQQPNDAPAAVRAGWQEVNGWITKAADAVPADKYSYRPVQTVRTFGQLIGHLADSYNWYCANASGRKVEWADPVEKGSTDKATLATKLKQATTACNTVYAGQGAMSQLMGNVAHSNLHYGNIITYMRMMGLVPPSS